MILICILELNDTPDLPIESLLLGELKEYATSFTKYTFSPPTVLTYFRRRSSATSPIS